MPVDTSRVAAAIRSHIPARPRRRVLGWPMGIAAMLLIALGVFVAVGTFSGPALASSHDLADIHDQISSGHSGMVVKVASIDDAASAISQQWAHAPKLPRMPYKHVMACCVHKVANSKMAVVGLEVAGEQLTMAVAESGEITAAEGETVVRDGIKYKISSADGVNMAMTERDGRWVCLMGRAPIDSLISVISKLEF